MIALVPNISWRNNGCSSQGVGSLQGALTASRQLRCKAPPMISGRNRCQAASGEGHAIDKLRLVAVLRQLYRKRPLPPKADLLRRIEQVHIG